PPAAMPRRVTPAFLAQMAAPHCMMELPKSGAMPLRRPPLLVTLAITLSACALLRADDFVTARFGDYLEALRLQAGIPGLAAAIVGPSEVMWERAFGLQDVERNIATRVDTPFQLDGTTQTFVAARALRCAEEGSLSLDDPVRKWQPASPDANATMRQLLPPP